jgi:DNA-binding response OmpR family regulator
MRILVVEDEKKTASFVRKALQAEGFAVDVCHHGDEALAAVLATSFDGIVLDIMLPGRDGLSVLRQLRERENQTPVLLLSARGEVNERVEGLNAGADDYLGIEVPATTGGRPDARHSFAPGATRREIF